MRKPFSHLLILLFIVTLSACGAGPQAPANRTLKAVIKSTALTANQNIAGIDLAITVPLGVSPPLLADGVTRDPATVTITSTAATNNVLSGVVYTQATATTAGQLAITGIVAVGFSANDQITINLTIANGTFPVESDFKLLSFVATDINGAPVTGLNPTLTTTIQ